MIVGPIQFDEPGWLVLLPIALAALWWIARRSLSGLATRTKQLAFAVRSLVVLAIVAALAEPSWRLEAEGVTTIFVWDTSRSMPPETRALVRQYLDETLEGARPEDRFALISTAEEALAQIVPSRANAEPGEQFAALVGDRDIAAGGLDGTDLAGAVRLALAVKPEDTAARIVMLSDGNETEGSVLAASRAADAAGVPIDVIPLETGERRDVMFEALLAPTTARVGQVANLSLVLEAPVRTAGQLTLTLNGDPFDLTPGEAGSSVDVTVGPGPTRLVVPVRMPRGGATRFEAFFTPAEGAADEIPQNNAAAATTFVAAEGAILLYSQTNLSDDLERALTSARLNVVRQPPSPGHASLEELQQYDAIILFDCSAADFSLDQQAELAAYVHDAGGGLVMIGGERSFGAGGWNGTPVADVLPVRLDPPAERQLPRGALALLMHSCEMPQGNFWGQKVAQAAVDSLSRLDLVGVIELQIGMGNFGTGWVYPLSPKGDGVAVSNAIQNLTFGDMQDFTQAMRMIVQSLSQAQAGQKHCIIISDGDPAPPPQALVQQFIDNGITISTVCVFPHTWSGASQDVQRMAALANVTGGQAYLVNRQNQLADLPQIFIKEAQIVRRSLIQETEPFQPELTALSEPLRGIGGLPAITGYVVTADRDGLSLVTARAPEGDPILAQWQHGLGRAVAFTSDATARWSSAWLTWGGFGAFWEQHVRWAMRPSGNANVSIVTRSEGDRTRVIVTALDAAGDTLNFGRFRGIATSPDLDPRDIEFEQTGPGRYEGVFESEQSGSYLVTVRYDAPVRNEAGETNIESGTVQAAVSKPFPDEFRALEPNIPLLLQVAQATNGRRLTGDPAQDQLFAREDVEMPVALTPIWLALTLAGIGLFLTDVAVRRVRLQPRAAVRATLGFFGKARKGSTAEIESLRAARERTRERLGQRSGRSADVGEAEDSRDPPAAGIAKRKFEAGADADAAGPVIDAAGPRPDAPKPAKPKPQTQKPKDDEQDGMSRLLAAKRRAMEQRDKDNEQDS